MITRKRIQEELNGFIEWDTQNKSFITTASAILFAEHIAKIAVEEKKKNPKLNKPNDVTEQVWFDFNALRKTKRAPLTTTALNGIQRQANKAGITLQSALELCCQNGWQGFSADWVRQKSTWQTKEERIRDAAIAVEQEWLDRDSHE